MKQGILHDIHENFINGNKRDVVKQIDEYGHRDFWNDYLSFCEEIYSFDAAYRQYTDVSISYNNIKHR